MIPKGTTFDYNVQGVTSLAWLQPLFTVGMFDGAVRTDLAKSLDVVSLNLQASTWVGVLPYQYVATLRVTTRVDHALASDVRAIVAHAFYEAAGTMPSIQQAGTAPPGSSAANTARPGPEKPFVLGEWLSSLLPDLDTSTAIAVGVVGLAVVVLVLASD